LREFSDPGLGEVTRVFAKIGVLSFGGPAGQIALMHRELVEERNWLDEPRFLHALNYCMMLPGPEAMQLATYAGWLLKGTLGGLIAGLLFVLPGAILITILSAIYIVAGEVTIVQGLLFGLKAASAASISLWLNLELVATAMLGAVLFRDFMGWRGWAAAGVATLATGILAWGGGAAGIRAAVLVALACACWGLDNQLTSLIDGLAPADATLWKGLAAGAMNLGIGLSLSAWAAGPVMTALALAIGASCYGASIILYITSAQRLGATRSQVIFSTAPFFGVLLAVVVLGEKLSLVQSGSGVLFVSALILLAKEKHQHAHKHEAMEHEHRHSHDDGHHGHRHPGGRPEAEHFHRHGHEQRSHAHPHWPDLHHRHEHD